MTPTTPTPNLAQDLIRIWIGLQDGLQFDASGETEAPDPLEHL